MSYMKGYLEYTKYKSNQTEDGRRKMGVKIKELPKDDKLKETKNESSNLKNVDTTFDKDSVNLATEAATAVPDEKELARTDIINLILKKPSILENTQYEHLIMVEVISRKLSTEDTKYLLDWFGCENIDQIIEEWGKDGILEDYQENKKPNCPYCGKQMRHTKNKTKFICNDCNIDVYITERNKTKEIKISENDLFDMSPIIEAAMIAPEYCPRCKSKKIVATNKDSHTTNAVSNSWYYCLDCGFKYQKIFGTNVEVIDNR